MDQLKGLQEGIRDSEKRMEEKMAAQMEEYVNGRFEDAKGALVTSTPGNGSKSEKGRDEDSESKGDEVSIAVEKQRTSKNRRHERLIRGGLSINSLYGSVDGSDKNEYDSESGEESGSEYDVKRSILIREVPRPGKYELKGTKDIHDFFKEYEKYCKERFSDNKAFWVNFWRGG